MKLSDAVKRAEAALEVKDLEKGGYYLNSGFTLLEPGSEAITRWTLTYYNPKLNQVVQVEVEGDSYLVKGAAQPLAATPNKLEMKNVKTTADNMLKKARKEYAKYKQPMSQIIISIQKPADKEEWRFSFITKTLFVVVIKMDAIKGKITSSEMESLTR